LQGDWVGVATALSPATVGHFKFLFHLLFVGLGLTARHWQGFLGGEFPDRIDAFYRLVNGLQIPFQEAVIAPTSKAAQGLRLHLVPDRRKPNQVA